MQAQDEESRKMGIRWVIAFCILMFFFTLLFGGPTVCAIYVICTLVYCVGYLVLRIVRYFKIERGFTIFAALVCVCCAICAPETTFDVVKWFGRLGYCIAVPFKAIHPLINLDPTGC